MQQEWKTRAATALAEIPHGAFLTTENQFNPMTIGWCQFGVVWGKPICTVFVRKSRFTCPLMENSATFCVSVPAAGLMRDELAYCGAHSGRDGDKAAATGLAPVAVIDGAAPGVDGCAQYFICKKLFSVDMDLSTMDADVRARYYGANQALANGDPHTVYFGEIVNL